MGPHFDLIKKKLGKIALALLPIGTFEPRQFMHGSHIDPQEAVEAMQILQANYAVGMHFDTFDGLADEPFGIAKQQIHSVLKQRVYQRFKYYSRGSHAFMQKCM